MLELPIMKEPVLVRAKYLRKETVCIDFKVVDISRQPNVHDKRTLSRSYTFDQNGEVIMPVKMAKILIEKNPLDFDIVKPIVDDVQLNEEISKIKKISAKAEGKFVEKCPICGEESKSKAGLSAHLRFKHLEYFKENYKKEK